MTAPEIDDEPDADEAPPDHQLTVEHRDPRELHRFHRNPRRGNVAALAASLAKSGQYKPITVNRGTLTGRPDEVLAGNHTRDAAIELDWPTVALVYVDVDEDEAASIVVKDNRLHDLGTYDDTELVSLLQDLPTLEATGYEDRDLEMLLRTTGALGDEVAGLFDEHASDTGGPAKASQVDGMKTVAAGYVTTSWTITPEQRDTVRQAIKIVQKARGLSTSAEAVVAMAQDVVEREESKSA